MSKKMDERVYELIEEGKRIGCKDLIAPFGYTTVFKYGNAVGVL